MSVNSRTRKLIVDAFNRLIRENPFDSITVCSICEEADIGRATFYRYFKDKYAVMDENYNQLLAACAAKPGVDGYEKLFYELLSEAHSEFWLSIRRSFSSEGYNSFRNYISDRSYDFAREITMRARGGKSFTPAEGIQVKLFTKGIAYIYEDWTFHRVDMSVEETSRVLYECLPESIRILW